MLLKTWGQGIHFIILLESKFTKFGNFPGCPLIVWDGIVRENYCINAFITSTVQLAILANVCKVVAKNCEVIALQK